MTTQGTPLPNADLRLWCFKGMAILLLLVAGCGGTTTDGSSEALDGGDGARDASQDLPALDSGPIAQQAAAPQFSPGAGAYVLPIDFTITTTTPGASIHYTVDGTDPDSSSAVFKGPTAVHATTIVKAIAMAPGHDDSPVSAVSYQCAAATPIFSIPGGSYAGAQQVQLSASTPNADIHFTTNGSDPDLGSPVYSSPIAIECGVTIVKAFAAVGGCASSGIVQATYSAEYCSDWQAAAPTFAPPGGSYAAPQLVTISTSTAGATIYYTLDGDSPTSSSTVYVSPLWIDATTTIKAVAAAAGYLDSPISSATYCTTCGPKVATPVFSLPAGSYTTAQTVQIQVTTPTAQVYYTMDGTHPTVMSPEYTAPISIAQTTTLQAFAVAAGMADSDVAVATYVVQLSGGMAAPPAFSPPGGVYAGAQSVTIASATAGAVVRFTSDGTDPTASSQTYTQPVDVSQDMVLKAVAHAPGYAPSPIAIAVYSIEP